MKKFILAITVVTLLSSCASIFCGSKAKVEIRDTGMYEPVTITSNGQTKKNVYLPTKVKVKRGYKPSKILVEAEGYEDNVITVTKKFNPISIINLGNVLGWGIDAATGAITKPDEKTYDISMKRIMKDIPVQPQQPNYVEDPTIPAGQATERVTRDNPGKTDLERTIIRWFFDSDPQGARIFWRVISSVPDEVKNTNELYLMTTPFEETRSFNIQGLTYENSRDVQIEIKVMKNGYEPQVKRFNVRQAIDQQEISSFFMLVKKDN